MTIANVTLSDTFDTWRTRTNELIIMQGQSFTLAQAAFSTANSTTATAANIAEQILVTDSYYMAIINNAANVVGTSVIGPICYATANNAGNASYALANNGVNSAYALVNNSTNVTRQIANSAFDTINVAFSVVNSAYSSMNATTEAAYNSMNVTTGAAFDAMNASYGVSNLACIIANNAANTANVFTANAINIVSEVLLSNTLVQDAINLAANISVSDYIATSPIGIVSNVANFAYTTANNAYNKANSANVLAYNTGIGSNAYTVTVGAASNTWANSIGDAGNSWSNSIGSAGNSWSNSIGSAGNAWSNSIGTAVNTWSNSIGTSSNAWANAVGVSGNAWANAVGVASNTTANGQFSSVNSYISLATANANIYAGMVANSKLANVIAGAPLSFQWSTDSTGNTKATINIATSGVSACTYGGSTQVPYFTVDSYGRVTSAGNVSFTGGVTSITQGTGLSFSSSPLTATGTISLAASGVGTGATVGSSSAVPVITYDTYGRITAITTASISASGGTNVSIGNETSSSSSFYPLLSRSTSGNVSNANVSTTKLTFVPSTGTLSATIFNSLSDRDYKTDITPITNALDVINSIDGVGFRWKDNGKPSFGVIAQDIENIIPALVDSVDDKKNVNYDGIIAFLIEAVKELSRKLDEKQ